MLTPSSAIGFLLAAATGVAFVGGAASASCGQHTSSSSASLTRALALSTSAFVFVGGALGDLLPLVRSRFDGMLTTDSEHHSTRGLGQALATASFVVGVVLQCGVNHVVSRLMAAATARDAGDLFAATQLTDAAPATSNHHVSLSIPAWMTREVPSTGEGGDFGPSSSAAVAFDAMQTVERAFEISAAAATTKSEHSLSSATRRRRSLAMSVLAVLLHHIPAGSIVYVAAMAQPRLGQVLAFAVALHSVPDGRSFAASIRHTAGCGTREIVWSLLSPVGRCCGALLGCALLREGDESAMARHFLSGIAAGGIVAIALTQVLPLAYSSSAGRSYGVVLGVVAGAMLLALPKVFA